MTPMQEALISRLQETKPKASELLKKLLHARHKIAEKTPDNREVVHKLRNMQSGMNTIFDFMEDHIKADPEASESSLAGYLGEITYQVMGVIISTNNKHMDVEKAEALAVADCVGEALGISHQSRKHYYDLCRKAARQQGFPPP